MAAERKLFFSRVIEFSRAGIAKTIYRLFVTAGVYSAVMLGQYLWQNDYRIIQPPQTNLSTELATGVHYWREIRDQPRQLQVHIFEIDLTAVEIMVTPGNAKNGMDILAETTALFLKRYGADLAFNANFFSPFGAKYPWDFYPHNGDPVDIHGLAISNGSRYSEADPEYPALCLATHLATYQGFDCPTGTQQAFAGNRLLVEKSQIIAGLNDEALHPRLAVGFPPGGRKLVFILVDGRQAGYSEGVTEAELALLAQEAGLEIAINLDGGGSATASGPNGPYNSTIQHGIPGLPRPVGNHIGIFVKED